MTAIITEEPIKVLADIVQHEMELATGQVMIYNQDLANMPEIPGKIIGNNNTPTDHGTGLDEVQDVSVLQMIQIDVMSANSEARTRCMEVVMALASTYAKQQMDKYQISIASHPGAFVDASEVEGTARMNRYTTTVMVNALYKKTKAIDFYGTFNKEVHTNV